MGLSVRKVSDLIPKAMSVLITPEKFSYLTGIVIDNFEGGYYHPNMKANMTLSNQKVIGDSGETMFGLDRKHGAQLAKYPEWHEFWKLVDGENAALRWRHYYIPQEPLKSKLKNLTASIMYKWFSELAARYILVGSMDEIANDDRLIIHFSYGCWNGEGWFKRYSDSINKAIQKHQGNKNLIFTEAFNTRLKAVKYIKGIPTIIPNPVIRQQGEKMMRLFSKLHL